MTQLKQEVFEYNKQEFHLEHNIKDIESRINEIVKDKFAYVNTKDIRNSNFPLDSVVLAIRTPTGSEMFIDDTFLGKYKIILKSKKEPLDYTVVIPESDKNIEKVNESLEELNWSDKSCEGLDYYIDIYNFIPSEYSFLSEFGT